MTPVVPLDSLVSAGAPICYGILMPGPGQPSGVPVIKVRHMTLTGIDQRDVLLTSPEIDAQYSRSRVITGDLLMSIRGTTGLVVKVPASLAGANITQDSARIRIGDPELRDFVYFALRSPFVQRQVALHTVGQAVKGINIGQVRQLSIPIPTSRDRMLDILRVLNLEHERIRRVDVLVAVKRRLKRALIERLCLHPSVPTRRFHLGDIATEVVERAGARHMTVLSCTKHGGLVDSLGYFGKRVFSRDTSAYRVVRRDQFAYATNHIEEGSIGLLRDREEGCVSPMYTVFACKDDAHSEYLFALLKTERYRALFADLTSGSVNRRGGLRWSSFGKITVELPPHDWQVRAASVIRLMDADLVALESMLAALRLHKRGVMQRLLSGEINPPDGLESVDTGVDS